MKLTDSTTIHPALAIGVSLLVFLVPPMNSQPTVTYDPDAAKAAGLVVTFGNDPNFDAACQPFVQHVGSHLVDIAPLKLYGVVIANTSQKAVAMLSVIYERIYAIGPSNTETVAFNTRGPDGAARLSPGKAVLILPGITMVGPISQMSQGKIADQARIFSGTIAVRVLLDAVIFEDGSLFGSDHRGLATTRSVGLFGTSFKSWNRLRSPN